MILEPIFSAPENITTAAGLLEFLMRGESHAKALIFIARRVTHQNDLPNWYLDLATAKKKYKCWLCGAKLTAGQETLGKKTLAILDAHREMHIQEVLAGKWEDRDART